MITPDYLATMARYNRWMNEGIYSAVAELSEEERQRDRGAFFSSIHGTLNHTLWGDQIWMHRFSGSPAPAATTFDGSTCQFSDFQSLRDEREKFDTVISDWAGDIDPAWLEGDMTWRSSAMNREFTKPRGLLVMQLFNHQTHHRGQVHCMLTQAGVETAPTDLPFMPA